MGKKIVRFTKHEGSYVPGDVAGFEDTRADRLVRAGRAVPHNDDAAETGTGEGATPDGSQTPQTGPKTPPAPKKDEPTAKAKAKADVAAGTPPATKS